MVPPMRRKRDHILLRPGSKFWRVRFQRDGKSVEQSLHTTDRGEAECLALPLIAQHRARLLARDPNRARFAQFWRHEYEPGREHIGPAGERVIATDRELIYVNADGSTRTAPNGYLDFDLIGGPINLKTISRATAEFNRVDLRTKDDDDKLIETYIEHAGLTGYPARETRQTWEKFRAECPGVKLANAKRDHGRKLVAHFAAQGDKRATIQHKISRLAAVVNFHIDEGLFTFNPFSHVLPKKKTGDVLERLSLSSSDVKNMKCNLGKLTASDQLLVTLLARTGMRVSEAFAIRKEEEKENGVRFTIVGGKTKASRRRVPLPNFVPPVNGPLFSGNAHSASNRLGRFLRKIGIKDKAKVIHSLRHRAQDQLRAAGCPQDIREELLGHEHATVGEGYGKGHPVDELAKWQAKIRF